MLATLDRPSGTIVVRSAIDAGLYYLTPQQRAIFDVLLAGGIGRWVDARKLAVGVYGRATHAEACAIRTHIWRMRNALAKREAQWHIEHSSRVYRVVFDE